MRKNILWDSSNFRENCCTCLDSSSYSTIAKYHGKTLITSEPESSLSSRISSRMKKLLKLFSLFFLCVFLSMTRSVTVDAYFFRYSFFSVNLLSFKLKRKFKRFWILINNFLINPTVCPKLIIGLRLWHILKQFFFSALLCVHFRCVLGCGRANVKNNNCNIFNDSLNRTIRLY